MKKGFILLLVVALGATAFVSKQKHSEAVKLYSGQGIEFVGMDFNSALAEAKKTNKLIFIDAYTSWCGPCKKMAATAFMDQNVSNVFNSKFINLKVEMEKSVDGPEIAKRYGVKAYPTLLFINGDGKLVKSVVGYQTPEQLLAVGKSLQ